MTDKEIRQEFTRVSPDGKTVQVMKISWKGSHTPISKWVDFGPILKSADALEINTIIEQAMSCEKFFRRCEKCRELKPIGWMHDKEICQSCAERYRGVVY